MMSPTKDTSKSKGSKSNRKNKKSVDRDDVVLVKNRKNDNDDQLSSSSPALSASSSPTSSSNDESSSEGDGDRLLNSSKAAEAVKDLETPSLVEDDKNQKLSRLSRFLKWYISFMSSAANQDLGLKLLQYSLWVVSKALQTSKRNLKTAALCNKLSGDLSFARYMTRLFELPAAMDAAMHGTWADDSSSSSSSKDGGRMKTIDAILGKILAYSMILYYPAEHVAFLHWMAPPPPAASTSSTLATPKTRIAERWSAWSCRGWLVYIVAEMAQGILQWRNQWQERQRLLKQQQEQNQSSSSNKNDESSSNEQQLAVVVQRLDETNRVIRNVQLQLTRNALFLLPAIHWSLPNWDEQPWLSTPVVNTLMWLETVVHLYKATSS